MLIIDEPFSFSLNILLYLFFFSNLSYCVSALLNLSFMFHFAFYHNVIFVPYSCMIYDTTENSSYFISIARFYFASFSLIFNSLIYQYFFQACLPLPYLPKLSYTRVHHFLFQLHTSIFPCHIIPFPFLHV